MKFSLELPIGDRILLPDQLVHALPGRRALALLVDVGSVSRARRLSIDCGGERGAIVVDEALDVGECIVEEAHGVWILLA